MLVGQASYLQRPVPREGGPDTSATTFQSLSTSSPADNLSGITAVTIPSQHPEREAAVTPPAPEPRRWGWSVAGRPSAAVKGGVRRQPVPARFYLDW